MRVRRLAAWTALPLAVTLGLAACGGGGDGGSVSDSRWSDPHRRAAAPGSHQHHRDERVAGARRLCSARWSTTTPRTSRTRSPRSRSPRRTTRSGRSSSRTASPSTTVRRSPRTDYIDAWNYARVRPERPGRPTSSSTKVEGYADLNRRPKATPKAKDADRSEEGRRPHLHRDARPSRTSTSRRCWATPRSTRCRTPRSRLRA